ncbi:acyl-CoA thioesterase [Fastidiosibacter lacustris]|uniref:acyl-CoA thioesterase n=1 Tax=Fastidiosibacter lacustris TaxID=2056695 RepID=UPI000E341B96|nr:acyl-CoA thioesterase [Fastidiosibacter lacustris]
MQAFKHNFTVTEEFIDVNKHVNNIVYLKWMQDIAIMHSNACGWTTQRYHKNHCTWVAKTHYIDYVKPAFLGEIIEARTWVEEIKRCSALRKYVFTNNKGETVVKAETNWVFINTITGKVLSVLAQVRHDFETFTCVEYV